MSAASALPTRLLRVMRGWQLLAAGGLAAFTAHTLFPSQLGLHDFFDRWLYDGLVLLALAACVLRAASVGAERGAWVAFGLALGAWSVGEILYDFVYAGDAPFPSVADAFYLAFYPLCYVGLLLLVRTRLSAFWRSLWLDGLMAALAAAALGAAVLFEVVLRTTSGSTGVIVTNLAYPLGDILLLSAVVGVLGLTKWRPDRTWLLLGAGLALSVAADSIYLFETAAGSYEAGTVLDAMWPASLLVLSSAAFQRPRRAEVGLEGRPLLAAPIACTAVGITVLVCDHFHALNLLAIALAAGTLLVVAIRMSLTFGENGRLLARMREHAISDALTGLGNRRRLLVDLERTVREASVSEPRLLAIFDLDGFKLYNDSFGHPAGDVLLTRLAGRLAAAVGPAGSSYRLGGDEFCVLARIASGETDALLDRAAAALAEAGEGFSVTSSFGAVRLPEEASTSTDALHLADERLYVQKRERSGRGLPHEMLLQALYEREPALRGHVQGVAALAGAVGRALGLSTAKLEELELAARLHDVGKLAIPDAVLLKPGPLDVGEWAFVKEHTVIGERILGRAPALREIGRIVRATHERWDGGGYPDGLRGAEIPLAARIIAVCDAFSAMTSIRPYRDAVVPAAALAELRRCSGTQFDPGLVALFCAEALRPVREETGPVRSAGAA